ncbi:MAG TPA: hypothetical protein VFZ77_15465 [Acidimicrobiales bacterium]
MPAETHQVGDQVDAGAVLDLLATVVGVEPEKAADLSLAGSGIDDDLSILHLWTAVAEEYGERSIGDLDLDDQRPATLGELAALFHASLGA